MIEGIMIALVTALITALGVLVYRWMNDIESKVRGLDDSAAKLEELAKKIAALEDKSIDTAKYNIQPRQFIELVISMSHAVKELRTRVTSIQSVMNKLSPVNNFKRLRNDEDRNSGI